jgi:hypothetical protein
MASGTSLSRRTNVILRRDAACDTSRSGIGPSAVTARAKSDRAYLPQEAEPVWFGVHSEIAENYGVTPDISEPHATTLDYVVAAAAG